MQGLYLINLTGQSSSNIALISFIDETGMCQVPFPFRFLFGKDVTLVSMFSFDLASSGKGEPFLGAGLSFHFWHY
jgi:hypothetical protein